MPFVQPKFRNEGTISIDRVTITGKVDTYKSSINDNLIILVDDSRVNYGDISLDNMGSFKIIDGLLSDGINPVVINGKEIKIKQLNLP